MKILIDKRYDSILPSIFKAFDSWIPSNLILWILSLVYIEISNEIWVSLWKKIIFFDYTWEETIHFNWDNLPWKIKDRINLWVEDIISVILLNPSEVYTKRIKEWLKESSELLEFMINVFKYFLSEVNIYMDEKTIKEYSEFILRKIILEKLQNP